MPKVSKSWIHHATHLAHYWHNWLAFLDLASVLMLCCPPSRSLSFLKADFAAVSFQLGFYTYQLFLSQDIKVEHAFASRESDRRMILNSIAGVSDLTASPDTSHPGWVTPQKCLLLMVLVMAMILMTRMKRCLEQLLFISCLPKTLQTLSSAYHGALSPAYSSALS